MSVSVDALTGAQPRLHAYAAYFRALVSDPRQTGSVVPSSRGLGRLMASMVDPAAGPVIEFGGGTGALTREILAAGLPPGQLEVLEVNARFVSDLRVSLPAVRIIEARAEEAGAHATHGYGGYHRVISGLPLLAMSEEGQAAVLDEALRLLAPGGAIVQFTYSALSPVRRSVARALDIKAQRIGTIWRNVPPATVFALTPSD